MGTYFDGMAQSFASVSLEDNKIDASEFLRASECLVSLLDLLDSSAFTVVQKDMTGNIKKIRDKHMTDPAKLKTLEDIVLSEAPGKSKTATQGLLWLNRGLQFTAVALRRSVSNPAEELTDSFTAAYNETLTKHHTMLVRPVFKLAMKACPYRQEFYKKLGSDQAKVQTQLTEWLGGLERVVSSLDQFYAAGNYGKGL